VPRRTDDPAGRQQRQRRRRGRSSERPRRLHLGRISRTSSSPKRRATHLAWLAAFLCPGLLVAGCGGGGGGRPLESVQSAVRSSLSQVPIVRPILGNPRAFGGAPAQVSGLGAFLFASEHGYERLDLPGTLDANGKPPRDFLDFLPGEIDLYPAAQTALPAGKRWIRLPLSSASSAPAARFVEQAEAVAPTIWLDEILWGARSATSRGTVVVNHVPFSTYDVAVDLRRAATAAKDHGELGLRIALEQELAALGGGHVAHVTVWRDGQGRIAQLQGTVPGTGLGSVRLDLFGYGTKVTPTSPPQAQLVPFTSIVGSKAWTASSPWVLASG
jgi:hypothetical protein